MTIDQELLSATKHLIHLLDERIMASPAVRTHFEGIVLGVKHAMSDLAGLGIVDGDLALGYWFGFLGVLAAELEKSAEVTTP